MDSSALLANPRYYVRGGQQVEAWSTKRLQFEPKGWQLIFREDLRSAIASLAAAPNELLHAVYVSPDKTPSDTENILFYNVGEGAFANSALNGLRFERAFVRPSQCPISLTKMPLHYHRYSLRTPNSDLEHWIEGDVLARLNAPLGSVNTNTKPASIWFAVKNGSVQVSDHFESPPQAYGLRVRLSNPGNITARSASIVKPVFDGVIAAFHYHDGHEMPEIGRRIGGQLGANPEEIIALLSDNTGAVLGKRRLVHRRGMGVQWNPGDDSCLVGELRVNQVVGARQWQLSGELFEIVEAN